MFSCHMFPNGSNIFQHKKFRLFIYFRVLLSQNIFSQPKYHLSAAACSKNIDTTVEVAWMYFYTISGLVEVLLLSIEFENDDAVLLICSGNVHLMCLLYRWLPAPSLALNNTVENIAFLVQ